MVEDDRTLLGLVTEFDLLRVVDEGKELRHVTAKEIMTPAVARSPKRCRLRIWSICFKSGISSERRRSEGKPCSAA